MGGQGSLMASCHLVMMRTTAEAPSCHPCLRELRAMYLQHHIHGFDAIASVWIAAESFTYCKGTSHW
jgi:hypothetical protein